MSTHRRIVLVALWFVLVLSAACAPTAEEPGIVQAPTPEVFVFPGPTEKILISAEDIPQPNCDGGTEMSATVERSHTVSRTLELGAGITVDASGQAGLPVVGQVNVGVAVATHYKVGYGSQDTVTRSVTVAAKEGTSMLHTIHQNEIWETGEVLITAGTVKERLPYRFRKDFSMDTMASANIGCPGQGAQSPSVETEPEATQPPGQSLPAQPAVVTEQPPIPTAALPEPSAQPNCPFLANSHIEQLRAAASVSDALQQAEDFAGHQQNDYSEGSIIPVGVVIATDLQNADLSLFPVSPVKNQGGWGLFITQEAFVAPNAGTYWCIR